MDNALAGIPEHVWRRELEKRAGAAACRAPSPEYFRWGPPCFTSHCWGGWNSHKDGARYSATISQEKWRRNSFFHLD